MVCEVAELGVLWGPFPWSFQTYDILRCSAGYSNLPYYSTRKYIYIYIYIYIDIDIDIDIHIHILCIGPILGSAERL